MAFKIQAKTSPAKARMTALAIPMPPSSDAEDAAEGSEEESGETCKVTISPEQLQELQDGGMVTLTADDGETVELSMSESESPSEDAGESGEEGM